MSVGLLVSVIVPVYNVESYIPRCIESIINQTYKSLEIILINDGSLDKSGEICDHFANLDSRIKVIHKLNGGVSSARNMGIERAVGEYILFVDSDDWIEPNMIEWLYDKIQNVDVAICGCYYHDSSQNFTVNHCNNKGIFDSLYILRQILLNKIPVKWTPWCKLYRSSMVKNIGGFNLDIHVAEDKLFLCTLFTRCDKIYYENVPLYHYLVIRFDNSRSNCKKNFTQITAQLYIADILHEYQNLYEISLFQMCDVLLDTYRLGKKTGIPIKELLPLRINSIKFYLKTIFYKSVPFKDKIRVFIKLFSPVISVEIWHKIKIQYM